MNLVVYLFLSIVCLMHIAQGVFEFVDQRLSKADAEEYCAATYAQGKLATIDTAARNQEVTALCVPTPADTSSSNGAGSNSGCYIGVTLEAGSFDDSSAITFSQWSDGEPSSSAVIIDPDTGDWTVALGEYPRSFVCEYAKSQLFPDEILVVTDYLLSDDERSIAVLQDDGNFVVYGWSALWSAGTADGNYNRFLILQGDGNIVLYNNDGGVAWAAGVSSASPAYLVMQDDGNLVAYDTNGGAYWYTNTAVAVKNGYFHLSVVDVSRDLYLQQQLKVVAMAAVLTVVLVVAYLWRKRVKKEESGVYQSLL
mmetsp:Transcript_55447/g.92168  ORF Transcript_55447/g.92168 Transcript_55447/m.92168 type:complete len:310 (-) Transcript_55447:239-1168(-)